MGIVVRRSPRSSEVSAGSPVAGGELKSHAGGIVNRRLEAKVTSRRRAVSVEFLAQDGLRGEENGEY